MNKTWVNETDEFQAKVSSEGKNKWGEKGRPMHQAHNLSHPDNGGESEGWRRKKGLLIPKKGGEKK